VCDGLLLDEPLAELALGHATAYGDLGCGFYDLGKNLHALNSGPALTYKLRAHLGSSLDELFVRRPQELVEFLQGFLDQDALEAFFLDDYLPQQLLSYFGVL